MRSSTDSFRHLLLGLLARQPMSGYDIKLLFKSMNWLIGSPSSGSLYPVLRRLHEEGLVTAETVPQETRPSRRVYSTTRIGRQVLRDWVNQPTRPESSLKTFLLGLMLVNTQSPENLAACLRQRRTQVAEQEQNLRETPAEPGLDQDLAFSYSLALACAELAWLDEALDQIDQRQSRRPAAAQVKGVAAAA